MRKSQFNGKKSLHPPSTRTEAIVVDDDMGLEDNTQPFDFDDQCEDSVHPIEEVEDDETCSLNSANTSGAGTAFNILMDEIGDLVLDYVETENPDVLQAIAKLIYDRVHDKV